MKKIVIALALTGTVLVGCSTNDSPPAPATPSAVPYVPTAPVTGQGSHTPGTNPLEVMAGVG